MDSALKGYKTFRNWIETKAQINFETWLDIAVSGQLDIYRLLDDFAGYLAVTYKPKLMPTTVRNRVYAAVSLLRYVGIKVDKQEFRECVTLPKPREIPDEPTKVEKLRQLVTAASPVLRGLYLGGTSNGSRISELCSIRVKDLDWETAKPAVHVRLRAEFTKTREARDIFITDEAGEALRAIIIGKKPDDLVFTGKRADARQDPRKLAKKNRKYHRN